MNKLIIGYPSILYDLYRESKSKRVYYDEFDVKTLVGDFNSPSMFDDSITFTIWSDIDHYKKFISSKLDNINNFNYFIPVKDKKEVDKIEKIEFKGTKDIYLPDKKNYRNWAIGYLNTNKIEYDNNTLDIMVFSAGSDFDLLYSYLRKCRFMGNTKDITNIIGNDVFVDYFKLISLIVDGDFKKAIGFIEYLNSKNADFIKFFYIFYKELRKLQLVKAYDTKSDYELVGLTGVFNNRVGAYKAFVNKYYNNIVNVTMNCANYDKMVKYKTASPYYVVNEIVYKLFT